MGLLSTHICPLSAIKMVCCVFRYCVLFLYMCSHVLLMPRPERPLCVEAVVIGNLEPCALTTVVHELLLACVG